MVIARPCAKGSAREFVLAAESRISREKAGPGSDACSNSKLRPARRLRSDQSPANSRSVFARNHEARQLCQAHPAHPVRLQRLPWALGRPLAGPQDQQHRGDEGTIDFQRQTSGRLGNPVSIVKDTLKLFEKEFDLPAVTRTISVMDGTVSKITEAITRLCAWAAPPIFLSCSIVRSSPNRFPQIALRPAHVWPVEIKLIGQEI